MAHDLADVTTDDDWRAFNGLRRSILWDARGRSGYDESHPDDRLAGNFPLLLKWNGRPIGTVRLDQKAPAEGVIRLVTIAVDHQRQGHGRVLSELIDARARRLGMDTLFVNSAPDAVGFYRKLGWQAYVWDASELVGFAADCVQMRKAVGA